VRAGFANTQWLHTVARQLADCGVPILGVVLVDPDPKDRTDGTLWDGLHTALRGRAAVVAKKQEDAVELELREETKPIEWPGKRDTERRRRPLDRTRPPSPVDPDAPTRRLKPVQES
ncbi:exopolysaccharide biosynthesis protein, partial [Amycolatopsis sp. NPDC000673]